MWGTGEEIIHRAACHNLEFIVLLYLMVDWSLLKNIYSQLPRSIEGIYFPDFSLNHVTCYAYGILADMI